MEKQTKWVFFFAKEQHFLFFSLKWYPGCHSPFTHFHSVLKPVVTEEDYKKENNTKLRFISINYSAELSIKNTQVSSL